MVTLRRKSRLTEIEEQLADEMPVPERIKLEQELAELREAAVEEVPAIKEPEVKPIREEVAPPDTLIEYPTVPEPASILERIYPEMFRPEASYGFTKEEIPEMVAQTIETFATEDPEGFLEDLRGRGRTADAEELLRVLSAGAVDPTGREYTPEEIEGFIEEVFAPPEPFKIPEEGYQFVEEVGGIGKLFTIRPDYSVVSDGEDIGTYNPDTGEIALKPMVSNKFLDGIETGLQYVEGWWKTGLMEAGFALYKGLEVITREENRWTSEAEKIMDSAYEKHGWKAVFSDEVNEAWDIYFQERQVRGPAKIIAELANPIWWTGAGGLAGLLAKPFSKIPVLGKTLQGAAKGVQATEEVALLPLTAPLKGGIRFAGKAIGIKPTRPFLTDVLPTASELKATLFKNDTFRKVAQHIPGMKWLAPGTVISERLPVTLITKPEIEGAVIQEILQRTAILEIGQGTKGQALAYLRELGTSKGILGIKNAMCSPRMVQPRVRGASLALGDVVQAPEQYIFKHKSGFEYCKRAQQVCREMYELATKEGIEIHKVGLEPFEEYVHWVCVGKIGKDGVLQMGRRGTKAVGGIVPAMKTRRFESMMDGIKAGYKYSDDLEIYVSSYVGDMFKAIGDKRLGDGLAEVIPKVEGMLPTKPLDRLIALYPEREIAWTGIRKEMADAGYALSLANRAFRGEVLPETSLRALQRRAPELYEQLTKALALPRKIALREKGRQFALAQMSRDLKGKVKELKPDWWKARFERSEAMQIVRKPILGREEGFIRTATGQAHPMFQNQIYPKVIADQATKLLSEEAAAFFKATAGISAAGRMAIAVLDISAWCIQGLIAQFAHPIKAGRANIAMIEALIKPSYFQKYLVKNAVSMNERIGFLGAQRPFEFFESMGWLVKMAGKAPGGKIVVGQTFGRAQASFSMWATVYKDLMWQACSKRFIRGGQGAEFARYLDRMTGMMSFNQLGMPANVKAFLAGWVSFAPQYRFSVISWFGELFKGGMVGTMARQDLAKLIAGATIAYTAWCKVTDNPIYLDPFRDGKKFMAINVDGHWIGIGAAVVSMIRASTDIAASALSIGENEPMDFLTLDKWQNPLMRMWYGQSAVLPKLITEIAQRRDYLGYPMESPEDWAKWAAEQITPIWLQDIFFDESGVPITPTSVLGNFAGLRTSPQTRWETLNDKILSLRAWEVVSDLTDEQREKIEGRLFQPGESVLSVLDRYQKAEMFNAFADTNPELIELYEKAVADALNRSSQIRKNYETATTSIKEEAVDSLTRAIDIGVKLDGKDTRWLRDRYGDIMNIYGAKNDILRDVEDYQDMFDEWDEAREKRKPEAELVDLAYWEYIEDVVSPDYELPNGDFDFEAYDIALADFKDKWGEEIYGKISYILENNKADYPDWAVKLWKDRKELNEGGYWKLPYKLISKMDEDDKLEGNIPTEYLALWERLQIAEDREAFIEANPILGKDWRVEFRLGSPEDDARLALWGYGGKLQTKEAYNLVTKWAEELGIPLEQIGLGLPPSNLIDNYFELNKIVAETSGSSIEAKLFKLEHPKYLEWGLEQGIWGDDLSDESIDALRLRDSNKDLTAEYEALSDIEDKKERSDAQKEWKKKHTNWVDDMRRVDMFEYSIDYPEALGLVEEFVGYGKVADKYGGISSQAKLYRFRHEGLNTFGMKKDDEGNPLTFGWDELEVDKVPIWQIDVDYAKQDEEYQAILDKYEGKDETVATNAYLYDKQGNPTEYCLKRYERNALEIGFPTKLIDAYVRWYTSPDLKKPDSWKKKTGTSEWYEDDWFLIENQDFYKAMRDKGIFKERRDFRRVPSREVFAQYLKYLDRPTGKFRDDYRWKLWQGKQKDFEEWLLLTGKVTVHIKDKKLREELTPAEEFKEDIWKREKRFKESLEEIEEKLKELGD